jgi:molybdopterin-synthase adenylyltransferase
LSDLGRPKVEALAEAVHAFDASVVVTAIQDVYRQRYPTGEAAFCCVDSIATRAVLWRGLAARVGFWADGRMLGETLRVLAAADEASRRHYPTTLFTHSEAHVGRCTARSTLYAASVAAGLLVHQFTRCLRGMPVDHDVTINLLAGEWTLAG